MDAELARWLITGAVSITVYLIKRTVDLNERRIEALEHSMQEVKMQYLHKSEFKEFKLELKEMFDDLKLDIRGLKFNGSS